MRAADYGVPAYNTVVTPTATAATGSTLTGWSPTLCSSPFPLTDNTTCTATFTLNTYPITATAEPAGSGTASCAPNPVDHGGTSTCTATANPGYSFTAWSGNCTGATCVLNNVTAAKTVTAHFSGCQAGPVTIDATTFGPGSHTRTSDTAIATQGSVTLQAGAEVTFRAPLQRLGPGFRVATGAIFHGRAEAVTCPAASRSQSHP